MESKCNGAVTYLALQRLIERAWDENDTQRLMILSRAVDEAAIRLLEEEKSAKKAG